MSPSARLLKQFINEQVITVQELSLKLFVYITASCAGKATVSSHCYHICLDRFHTLLTFLNNVPKLSLVLQHSVSFCYVHMFCYATCVMKENMHPWQNICYH